jgi:hypothetical protein
MNYVQLGTPRFRYKTSRGLIVVHAQSDIQIERAVISIDVGSRATTSFLTGGIVTPGRVGPQSFRLVVQRSVGERTDVENVGLIEDDGFLSRT